MSLSTSVALLSTLLAVGQVHAQVVGATGTFPATPLAQKTIAYDDIPYQVDTDTALVRGIQVGYNQCNSTTSGQEALCQTSIFNGIDDFCLWAPPELAVVADTEGEMVTWCTKDHGGRLIPEGTLTGLQLIETDEYFQLTGFINGPFINIEEGDFGGELDPHGADLRGNPLGGLYYSSAFGNDLEQVFEWHQFIGADGFCLRVCRPSSDRDAEFCEHIYDRIGCAYNDPADAVDGEFTSCQGDVGLPPGRYIEDGVTMTYTQPGEEEGAITSMPYTATVPPYSQCTTYTSSAMFAALADVEAEHGVSDATSTGADATGTGSAGGAGNTRGAAAATAGASEETGNDGNGAAAVAVSGVSLVSVVLSALFLS